MPYEALSPGAQRMLDSLHAVHAEHFWALNGKFKVEDLPSIAHPVVRTKPATGRCALYVSSA